MLSRRPGTTSVHGVSVAGAGILEDHQISRLDTNGYFESDGAVGPGLDILSFDDDTVDGNETVILF